MNTVEEQTVLRRVQSVCAKNKERVKPKKYTLSTLPDALAEDMAEWIRIHEDLDQWIRTHEDLDQWIRTHEDLDQWIRIHEDLDQWIRTHEDLDQWIRTHEDLDQWIGIHEDLDQWIRTHEDLDQWIRIHEERGDQPSQRDYLREAAQESDAEQYFRRVGQVKQGCQLANFMENTSPEASLLVDSGFFKEAQQRATAAQEAAGVENLGKQLATKLKVSTQDLYQMGMEEATKRKKSMLEGEIELV